MESVMNYPVVSFPKLGISVDRVGKTLLGIILAFTMLLTGCGFDQVIADIDVIIETANAIGAAVGAVSPADAALIQGLASTAHLGMNAIKAAYDTYKASGAVSDLQKLQAAIQSVQTNLPQELSAAHIVDPVAVKIVTAWVGLIVSTLNAILSALPQLTSASVSTHKKMKLAATLPTKASIKARWSAEVCQHDAPCVALVK